MRFPRSSPPGLVERIQTTMHRYRTHTCGALRASDIGSEVRLSGWCHRIRDHGGVLFIDLRDHYGLTQVRGRSRQPGLQGGRDAALGMGGARRRQGAARGPTAPRIPTCRPARSRSTSARSRFWDAAAELPHAGVRRAGLSRGHQGSSTASSTCVASICTTTS